MQIPHNHTYLFFHTSISDINSEIKPTRYLFSFINILESISSQFLINSLFWYDRSIITIYPAEVVIEPIDKIMPTTLRQKIIKIAISILLIIPGILIKACVWTIDAG